ncbi:hypothetical protein [Gulosibacter sp. ACHW.36C]|uniref:DUF3052 domain-containing protein n=1 Tax=Gulosibacter sediminis TaxID=1729695 RepID=A0ABY4MTE8_9MICO|nr:hypothetical protein [Gulosibacter sediminis]UQN13713.1 hypothetical protein M3M28_06365 [Gulosibacter sediminis]
MSTTADHAALQKKLQLKPGTRLWVWPETQPHPPELTADTIEATDLADADVAVLFTNSLADVDAALDQHIQALAPLRAVWFIYPKGNATDFNRDTLWNRLLRDDWRANSNVSYNETLSAIRVRPLKPGETVRQA